MTGSNFIKKLKVSAIIASACLLMAGCSSSQISNDAISPVMNDTAYGSNENFMYSSDDMREDYDSSFIAENSKSTDIDVKSSVTNDSGSTTTNNNKSSQQKLIRNKRLSAETEEFDNVVSMIKSRVSELGGYIESSSTYGTGKGYDKRNMDMTIRIPSERLDEITGAIKTSVTILSESESVRDVTLDYVDMASHVKALRAEQESLLSMLEKAEELSDIIAIQSQLTQVRYEIESYESSLRTIDNQVDYSTIYLELSEVERETEIIEEKSFLSEVTLGLKENLYDIGEWFRDTAIWLIVNIPYIIIWVVIIIIVIVIIKKKKSGITEKLFRKASDKAADKKEKNDAGKENNEK